MLSRGLLTGLEAGRPGRLPRTPAALHRREPAQNNQLVAGARTSVAREKGVTPAQLAIAWALAKGTAIIPRDRRPHPRPARRALRARSKVTLTAADVASLEAAVPADAVAGTRYDAHQMATSTAKSRTSRWTRRWAKGRANACA